jgi:hypothetical protein
LGLALGLFSHVQFSNSGLNKRSGRSAAQEQGQAMRLVILTIMLLLSGFMPAPAAEQAAPDVDAGNWKPWVIPSGKQFRVPPPPDHAATEREVVDLAGLGMG